MVIESYPDEQGSPAVYERPARAGFDPAASEMRGKRLGQTTDPAAVPPLAALWRWGCDADRFHADLLMDAQVEDPFLRAFTAAARTAPVPVVLGGHSLVAGGLAALLEGAGLVTFS